MEYDSNILPILILIFIFAFRQKVNVLMQYNTYIQSEEKIDENSKYNIYEKNMDLSNLTTDIKVIALYLPQFHAFKENDIFWGKGFTEWTNVKKAKPLFKGHYQPRIPDPYFGYYNLSLIETVKKQVNLAKQHGIYGFGIYYYWFSGKALMNKPIENILFHKEIIFPFFLIWANENWSRTWDGCNKKILIKQQYLEDDPIKFIKDIKKYLEDDRYIKIEGKPVIGFYALKEIPKIEKIIAKWRETALEIGIGEILIWNCISDGSSKDFGYQYLFDAEYEFPPRNKFTKSKKILKKSHSKGFLFNYEELVEQSKFFPKMKVDFPVFRGTMGNWDNSARKIINYNYWFNFSLEKFYLWNKIIIEWTRKNHKKDQRFIFVNAWNEWGEGTYLEPDSKFGYAMINSLSKAIFDLPFKDEENTIIYTGGTNKSIRNDSKIAVQAHIYYIELVSEIIQKTNNIPIPFDLYITTTSKENSIIVKNYISKFSKANHFEILIVANKGRDIYPLIKQMKNKIFKYDYFCHIHTKKTINKFYGDSWRNYLYNNLLGSDKIIKEIISLFENNVNIGIIYPDNFNFIKNQIEWGNNKKIAELFLSKIVNGSIYNKGDKIEFPAGNMFWARGKSVRQIFEFNLEDKDIPEERNQYDGTIMHAIERIWLILAKHNGYTYRKIRYIFDNRPLFN